MPRPLTGLSDPSLTLNLSGVTDYSAQMPFVDIMHMSRGWIGHLDGQYGGFDYSDFVSQGLLDANGYPTDIPAGVSAVETIWDWEASADYPGLAASRAGTYVITWEGQGTVTFGGEGQVVSQTGNRIVFDNPGGGTMFLSISETDPNGTGNHIRNISVVRQDHMDLHEAGVIFRPDWLALVEDARQFRFMDWMNTNNSQVTDWADRNTPDSASWVEGNAVPVEVMVDLANLTGTDPWFTMPHLASDAYVRAFATYVRDNLDPDLVVTVELSNEPWNFLFEQTHHYAAQAEQMWGNTLFGFPDHYSAYAMRAVEVARIWQDVFSASPDRLHTTLGAFTGDVGTLETLLTAPAWQQSGDPEYVPPHQVFDSVAVTSYFGADMVTDPTRLEALRDAIEDPSVDARSWLTAQLSDPGYENSVPGVLTTLAQFQTQADAYGLDVIIYEGGQHVHHLAGTSGAQRDLSEFFTAYVRSEDMADLYQALWDGIAALGLENGFMQFGDVALPGEFGSWGVRIHLNDDPARAVLLDQLNASTPAWWEDRGGPHFQQGVFLTGGDGANAQDGTVAEDVLIGRGGADSLAGYAGDDGMHGGAGNDRLWGGAGDDTLAGGADRDVLRGDAGDDVLRGGFGNDTLRPGQADSGDDWLEGGFGHDWIGGGAGHDTAHGGPGRDTVFGAHGDDVLFAQAPGASGAFGGALWGGPGADLLSGDAGADLMGGGADNDSLFAYGGADQIFAGDGADTVRAGPGTDTVYGGRGTDLVFGGAGDDLIFGGDQSDTLDGGAGRDTLTGGGGEDLFVVSSGGGQDVITDFNPRQDSLDLRALGLTSEAALRGALTQQDGAVVLSVGGGTLRFEGLRREDFEAETGWLMSG